MLRKHKSYTKIYHNYSNMQNIVAKNIKYSVKHEIPPVNYLIQPVVILLFITFIMLTETLCVQ